MLLRGCQSSHPFAVDLDLSHPVLEVIDSSHAFSQLHLEVLSLQRQRRYFCFDLPDLLLSILKNQQLFQFRMHSR